MCLTVCSTFSTRLLRPFSTKTLKSPLLLSLQYKLISNAEKNESVTTVNISANSTGVKVINSELSILGKLYVPGNRNE